MKVAEFEHNGTTYEFEPPIVVPDGIVIKTLGHLASFTLRPDNVSEGAEGAMAEATAMLDEVIARNPEPDNVVTILKGFLLDRAIGVRRWSSHNTLIVD